MTLRAFDLTLAAVLAAVEKLDMLLTLLLLRSMTSGTEGQVEAEGTQRLVRLNSQCPASGHVQKTNTAQQHKQAGGQTLQMHVALLHCDMLQRHH